MCSFADANGTSLTTKGSPLPNALPSSLSAAKIELGDVVQGLVAAVHPEQVLITLQPSQLNALLSLSNLSHHRALTIEQIRASLKPGDHIDDLVVVSKNSTSGLLIVANKTHIIGAQHRELGSPESVHWLPKCSTVESDAIHNAEFAIT